MDKEGVEAKIAFWISLQSCCSLISQAGLYKKDQAILTQRAFVNKLNVLSSLEISY